MTTKETVCPMTGQVCRFASEIRIPVVNRTIDLKEKVIRKVTTYDNKVPLVPYVVSELDWSRRRDSGAQ